MTANFPSLQHLMLRDFPTEALSDVGRLLKWEFFLYGGAARVFYLRKRGVSTPRDLDLVVRGDVDLEEVLKGFKPRKNRFGGIKFKHKNVAFDVWLWKDTRGIQGDALADLYATSFFNIEQVTVRMPEGTLHFSEEFDRGFKDKILEHSGFDNPFPKFQAVRAAVFADRYKLKLGPNLKAWINDRAPNMSPGQLQQMQCLHYGNRDIPWASQKVLSGAKMVRILYA